MESNVLLSKIVANPGEKTWAQAYSTLNLYIVLSIKSEEAESIVTLGKELFERIQREYFSLDKKDLASIKRSVEDALESNELKDISVILATINQNILYIVTASGGSVVLKRGEKVGTIASGQEGEIASFSGELQPDDIVILETQDFSEKIPVEKLSGLLDHLEVSEISESLAPLIHESPSGTEAAIILQYKKLEAFSADKPEEEKTEDEKDDFWEEPEKKEINEKKGVKLPKIALPSIPLPSFKNKGAIVLAIVLLVLILLGSVYFERNRQENAKREAALNEVLEPAQKKFDEATALVSLNKGLALDEFTTIKSNLESSKSNFEQGTKERKKLDEFIGKVEGKIGELGAGSTLSNQQVIYEKADLVGFKENSLFIVQGENVITLSPEGKAQKESKTENADISAVNGDKSFVYAVGDSGITKTDKKSGKTSTAVKGDVNAVSIDTFGANVYTLNSSTKTVDKYAGATGPRSDYFKGSITLSNPVSMAIDGSVWIIDDGKIRKFTKGAEDTFTINGLTKDLSDESKIFTSPDYSDVYILDKGQTRIISISKSGEVKNQYVSKELSNASSFAVDESGNKIYAVVGNKLYSFDL